MSYKDNLAIVKYFFKKFTGECGRILTNGLMTAASSLVKKPPRKRKM